MASTGFVLGAILIVGLFVLGVFQSANLPHSTLAGAVVDKQAEKQKTQQELNLCMNDCMRDCVKTEGMEQQCLDKCNPNCGAT